MATGIVDEFITLLGFEEKAGSEKQSQSFIGRLESVGKFSLKAVAALSTAALAVGYFTRKLTEGSDEAGKFAASYGTSADALEEIGFVASKAGADAKSVMKELADESVRTGETVDEALARLTRDFEGLDPQQQQRLASSLGISQDLLRVLQQGNAAIAEQRQRFRDLGGGLSDEARQNAADFNNALTESVAIAAGLGREFEENVLPAITAIVERVNNFVAGLGDISDGIKSIFEYFTDAEDEAENARDFVASGTRRQQARRRRGQGDAGAEAEKFGEATGLNGLIDYIKNNFELLPEDGGGGRRRRGGSTAPVPANVTQSQADNRQSTVNITVNESKDAKTTAREVANRLNLIDARNQIIPADGVR